MYMYAPNCNPLSIHYYSGHQLNATEGHSTISLYSGWDYTDFTALAHIPLRPPNDYYPLNDILSSGQALEGTHINILAIVRHVRVCYCKCYVYMQLMIILVYDTPSQSYKK